ncbi:MAG TPA: site-specific integrase [Planctomycetaceae bacterium]|jgi:integrase|nr:site-specific integrase [Planctomycetaceae bacterium]
MTSKNEITVRIARYGRSVFYMRYTCPLTGRRIAKSTGETDEDAAWKAAGKWQDELRDGRYKSPSKTTWAEFRQRYDDEVLESLKPTTRLKRYGVFAAVERILNPSKPSDLTAERLSTFQAKLRKPDDPDEEKRTEATIKSHLAHLMAALAWAKDMGMIHEVPRVKAPKRAKKSGKSSPMKGRAISGEEFDRLLENVAAIVADQESDENPTEALRRDSERIDQWKRLLRGLWWGGLRLGEALELWWDRDDKIRVEVSGDDVVLQIPGELEKGNQDRVYPVSPEFAEMLLAVPVEERTGRVFPLRSRRGGSMLNLDAVSKIICKIGKKAGVVVSRAGKVKYASAHDCRRAFGSRWARELMPQELMDLMRHESIETTLRYYVEIDAATLSGKMRAAVQKRELATVLATHAEKTKAAGES